MACGVAIVGAGHGGAHAASVLRAKGFSAPITLIGDEACLPYERPPLSKAFLAGSVDVESFLIRDAAYWREANVDLRMDDPCVSVDAVERRLTLASGETVRYDHLIWAAGGEARRLACPGADLGNIFTIRNAVDVQQLRAELTSAKRAVIVGGGYIGCECAATLSQLGVEVTLAEAESRLLARVAGREIAGFIETLHAANGVNVMTKACVRAFIGETVVDGVEFEDGTRLPADLVIVGIGIAPAVGPLRAAGAEGALGVKVDGLCRTTLPDVYAIGDVAEHENAFADGRVIRLESVQNAVDQAAVAAGAICGEAEAYNCTPTFWSDQFDVKLQTAGLFFGCDATLLRGAPADRRFSVLYLKAGTLIAADCVNMAKDFMAARKMIGKDISEALKAAADPAVPLKRALAG